MADRFATKISIGGAVPRSLVPALCDTIRSEGVYLDWNTDYQPESEDDLWGDCDPEGHLTLTDPERAGGSFDRLEPFLQVNNLPYDKHVSAKYEYDAILVFFRPGRPVVCVTSNEAQEALVSMDNVIKVRDLLRMSQVNDALTVLDTLITEVEPLPPFKFID